MTNAALRIFHDTDSPYDDVLFVELMYAIRSNPSDVVALELGDCERLRRHLDHVGPLDDVRIYGKQIVQK